MIVTPGKSGLHLVRKVMAAEPISNYQCFTGSWKFDSGAGERGQNFEGLDLGFYCGEEIVEAVRLYEASERGN